MEVSDRMSELEHAVEQATAEQTPATALPGTGFPALGFTPAGVLELQRRVGNRGAQAAIALARVPRKSTSGEVVDLGALFERAFWGRIRQWRTGADTVPDTGELVEILGF